MKALSLLLTMTLCVFQSIEREEPIEVDPAPTHAGLENGHAATTGNRIISVSHHGSAHFTVCIKMLNCFQLVSKFLAVTAA